MSPPKAKPLATAAGRAGLALKIHPGIIGLDQFLSEVGRATPGCVCGGGGGF